MGATTPSQVLTIPVEPVRDDVLFEQTKWPIREMSTEHVVCHAQPPERQTVQYTGPYRNRHLPRVCRPAESFARLHGTLGLRPPRVTRSCRCPCKMLAKGAVDRYAGDTEDEALQFVCRIV